jgi:S1-C subfamily serine protease
VSAAAASVSAARACGSSAKSRSTATSPQETSVLVASLEPYRPATHVGLLEGDTVIALDGVATPAVDGLHKLLTGGRIGARVIITFLRDVELRRHAIIPSGTPPRA